MEAFGADGALAATLPGFTPRPQQAALAQAVATALARGEHLVAEAGTGTGKSLAYLLPALAWEGRVVVATATKALQQQLLGKDVPAASRALGREFDVALLKGRQNYLCRRQLQGFGQMLLRSPAEEAAYEAIEPWIATTESGDRAELALAPPESLWEELAVGSDRCAGRHCSLLAICFAEAARARAAEAELVIVNHALYFAHLAAGGGVLPDHDAVIFDEAHRLEETAATWLGGRVSRAALRRLAADVERGCREESEPLPARALDRVERAGERLLSAVEPSLGRRRIRELPAEDALVLVDALASLADGLGGRVEALDQLAQRALDLAGHLERCLEADPLERVVWAEPGLLAYAPVDVSGELRRRLWAEGPTAILVSATLTTGEDATFVRRRLGLDHARELVVDSPFHFSDQALLYVPRAMPDPRSATFGERVADTALRLVELSRGRALVLTSSYRALGQLRARFTGALPYPLLVQGDAPVERLLERFRNDVDSVLLATSTFWQGVDVPGESLSLLVIDKLPFSAPADPLHEARCEAIAAAGGDWFAEYALPLAVLQLRQGFGRLIRTHADAGVVAILDPRLRTRTYGAAFLAALPGCPLVDDLGPVAAFFAGETPLESPVEAVG